MSNRPKPHLRPVGTRGTLFLGASGAALSLAEQRTLLGSGLYKPLVQPSVEQERLRRLAYGERLRRLRFVNGAATYRFAKLLLALLQAGRRRG